MNLVLRPPWAAKGLLRQRLGRDSQCSLQNRSHPSPQFLEGIQSHTGALATPTIVYCKKPGDFVMSHGLSGYSTHYLRKLFHGIGSIDADGGCAG